MEQPTIQLVNTSSIVAGDNDRRHFNDRELGLLAESIAQNGLAQPITVRPIILEGRDVYQIVAGERRFRACATILHWDTIPAIVRDLDDEQADAIMLTENVHRVDLDPVDEGAAYAKRIERHGWTIAEVSRRANVSEGRIKSRLALQDLVPEAQQLVSTGNLNIGLGVELSKLDNNRQRIALAWIRDQPTMPARAALIEVVNKLFEEQAQESLFDLDALFVTQVQTLVEDKGDKMNRLIPRRVDLPDVDRKAKTDGQLIDRYLAALLDAGKLAEASVIADFWAKSLDCNGFRVSPFDSEVIRSHPEFIG